MKEGLLWFDNDPRRTLTDKVRLAVARYTRKHGIKPSRCFVHKDTPGIPASFNGVEIRAGESVLRNHFWLGDDDESGVCQSEVQL